MGATLDGVPFFVDPTSISWGYSVKLSDTKTIGGKVIQIFGVKMGDLVVGGTLGANGPERQREWFSKVKAMADKQVPVPSNPSPTPVRFAWPERQWDFMVYIKSMVQVGSPTTIQATVDNVAPKFTLTMVVVHDNGSILRAAEGAAKTAYLTRLTAGMGWRQSEWNGPQNFEDVRSVLQGQSLREYLLDQHTTLWQARAGTGNAGGE